MTVWQMGIVLHRVVLVRIHLSGVMYSGEKYSWSDKKTKRGVLSTRDTDGVRVRRRRRRKE